MAFLFNESLCEYLLQSVQPVGIKGSGRDIAVRESLAQSISLRHISLFLAVW
jgi:hypothetical protein